MITITRELNSLPKFATCVVLLVSTVGCSGLAGDASAVENQAKELAAALLIDPGSAQFRNVRIREDEVCGEINGKNRLGAFVGFKRFVVDTALGDAQIDQEFSYSDLLQAESACSGSYTMSSCERASALRLQQTAQDEFLKAWTRTCGGAQARMIYRPPLKDPSAESDAPSISPSLPASDEVEEKEHGYDPEPVEGDSAGDVVAPFANPDD